MRNKNFSNLCSTFKSLNRHKTSLLYKTKYCAYPPPSLNKQTRQHKVVVSLTTHGLRINNVDLTIRSLFEQTYKPDVIVLNLDHAEFNSDNIPQTLKRLEKYGLKIQYTENFLSYNKLIPTLISHPNDCIITVDDDVIYPHYLLKRLIDAYSEQPSFIHGFRGYRITNKSQNINPYRKWVKCVHGNSGKDIMLTGVAGILYWPGCLHADIAREDLFMSLAPTSDDIWLKAMSLLNDVPCSCIGYPGQFKNDFHYTANANIQPLNHVNNGRGNNDQAVQNLLNHYPDLAQKINDVTLVNSQ